MSVVRLLLAAVTCLAGIAFPVAAQDSCGDCHEVDPAVVEGSVHGFLECLDCHSGASELPHPEGARFAICAECHEDAVVQSATGPHAGASDDGAVAADCAACHGKTHTLLPASDPDSPVHPLRLAATCGACHANPNLLEKYGIRAVLPIEAYQDSVHARALADDRGGATCIDCHGTHDLLASDDPDSRVYHQSVPNTCATCHAEIARVYNESVHGKAASHGIRESPVCTDCHGEHRILSPSEPGSPVYATNIPKKTCGHCHGDLQLATKFGIATDAVAAYQDSYHGLATESKVKTVAHCGSCHGVHDIRPSSDPLSHVHETNLAATCGRCHPGAGRTFAIGPVHVLPKNPEHSVIYYIRMFYLLTIYVVIGGMCLHNGMDLVRKMRNPPPRPGVGPVETRLMSGFRLAHLLLMLSFVVLAYTGFALKYPDAWWARPLMAWERQTDLRGWLHRMAAIVMIAALAIHVVHLAVSRRARRVIARMRPGRHDFLELWEKIRYWLGLRADPPTSPAVGYPEKLEYISMMWGIAIMAVTGFALWFENLTLRWLPKAAADVATVIHFYEAVLASLAILVWHLYFVIFDPVVYPMDTAWLNGREHPGRAVERGRGPAPPIKKEDS